MAGLHGILNDPLLSVVMPVYNERDTIESMIARVLAVPGIRVELIVVDDGSKDGTTDIVRGLQETYGFKLLLKENGGKGSALRRGFHRPTSTVARSPPAFATPPARRFAAARSCSQRGCPHRRLDRQRGGPAAALPGRPAHCGDNHRPPRSRGPPPPHRAVAIARSKPAMPMPVTASARPPFPGRVRLTLSR